MHPLNNFRTFPSKYKILLTIKSLFHIVIDLFINIHIYVHKVKILLQKSNSISSCCLKDDGRLIRIHLVRYWKINLGLILLASNFLIVWLKRAMNKSSCPNSGSWSICACRSGRERVWSKLCLVCRKEGPSLGKGFHALHIFSWFNCKAVPWHKDQNCMEW